MAIANHGESGKKPRIDMSTALYLLATIVTIAARAVSASLTIIIPNSPTASLLPCSFAVIPAIAGATVAFLLMLYGYVADNSFCQITADLMQQSATWYMNELNSNPLLVKSITTGIVGYFGDYMAQWIEYKLGRGLDDLPSGEGTMRRFLSMLKMGTYDRRRGLSVGAGGLLVSGPLMHVSYEVFEAILPVATADGGGSSLVAMIHVLGDCLILDSLFVAITLIATSLLEGYSSKQLLAQLRKDYVPALQASLVTDLMLVPFEFVCFRWFPPCLRVFGINCIDVVWDTVISFMTHRSRKPANNEPENTSKNVKGVIQTQHESMPASFRFAMDLQ